MNRIRIGLLLTMILGSIYAFSGLLTSLREFGIGVAVVAGAIVLHGLVTFIEQDDRRLARRDGEW